MLDKAGQEVRGNRSSVVYILLRDGETSRHNPKIKVGPILTRGSRNSIFCVGIGSVVECSALNLIVRVMLLAQSLRFLSIHLEVRTPVFGRSLL